MGTIRRINGPTVMVHQQCGCQSWSILTNCRLFQISEVVLGWRDYCCSRWSRSAAASLSDQKLSDTLSIGRMVRNGFGESIVLHSHSRVVQSCNSSSCHAFKATMNCPNEFTSSWAVLAASRAFLRHTTKSRYLGDPTTLGKRQNCIRQSFFSTLWIPSKQFVCALVGRSLNVSESFTVNSTAPRKPPRSLCKLLHNLCSQLPVAPTPIQLMDHLVGTLTDEIANANFQ